MKLKEELRSLAPVLSPSGRFNLQLTQGKHFALFRVKIFNLLDLKHCTASSYRRIGVSLSSFVDAPNYDGLVSLWPS